VAVVVVAGLREAGSTADSGLAAAGSGGVVASEGGAGIKSKIELGVE